MTATPVVTATPVAPAIAPDPPVPAAGPAAPLAARPPPDPLQIRLGVDLPILALGAAIALGTELVGGGSEQRWAGCGGCSPTDLNALDRTVIGKHSHGAAVFSDAALAATVGLPFVLDLGDVLIQRARDRPDWKARHMRSWGKDAVVLLETFFVNFATTNVVKLAVRRPRPYSYDETSTVGDPTENQARLSFYSGHASSAFAMATAYAYLFQLRHPRSRWALPVWVLGLGLASATAVARVEAGKHFWTDVIVGATAGTAIGLLVPALHRHARIGEHAALRLAPTRTGSLLLLQGRF